MLMLRVPFRHGRAQGLLHGRRRHNIFAQTVRVPPFELDGKQAVGVMVYSCDEGKTRFVGYLYRYTPEGKARVEEMIKQHRAGPPVGLEVKRPGAGHGRRR